ncbi:sugar ABC transporter permease [Paenibacillus sp. IB182496]|uniref:Sugar ABC transporter permease n=1 Tax=Paenibacillus sabuli TaxID=2772509 RepID=A0A927BX59_9BACL|nr:ABC transporter permease subunit [Paenibacillus sabuli]MBD2847521.1 sugar ABC transporter permease [Paenibacillus sabuli]
MKSEAAVAAARPGRFRERLQTYRHNRFLIYMFLPGFLIFFIFSYVPMYGIMIAFKDYRILDGIAGSPWAGLEHFRYLFAGQGFTNALRNTVVIALLKYLFVFPAPIILALLLNEIRLSWFRRTIQTISYLPHFFSWVILGGILFTFLGREGGFNQILGYFGLPPVNWLIEPSSFYGMVVITDIWQSIGWGSIVYFAALAGIDPTLYEAAIADGASRWRRIWHITLPSLVPVITIMLLLSLGNFLQVGFDQIYNLMTPTTSDVGDILDTYVLRRLLTMDYEVGAAAGIFSSVFGLLLVIVANYLVKLYDKDQGIW